jgi:hypothetical protein
MRCARCGGLTVIEEFKDFGLESCGNGFLGQRCINCGAIIDLVIAAHQRVTSPAAASLLALTTVQGSSLPLHRIEQRITTRF